MIPVEDMKSCIQEWFAQEYTLDGVALLYFELRHEMDKQLHATLAYVAKEMHENGMIDDPKEK